MRDSRQTGVGVDSTGGPVIDPTQNVLDLVQAANLRQDDLRQLNDRRIDAEIRVLATAVEGIETRMILRAKHAKEIRDSETRRLDAIRQVDVLAVGRTAEQQLAAVQTLAATTTSAAETIRASVTSTATALATQLANTVSGLTERISALEKSSYEGAGKGVGTTKLIGFIFGGCSLAIAAGGFILGFLVVLAGIIVYAVRAGG
jgi:hypothetical protein